MPKSISYSYFIPNDRFHRSTISNHTYGNFVLISMFSIVISYICSL
nr:MAG TPA: hypothetical protein [Caudoviricetes sp.]